MANDSKSTQCYVHIFCIVVRQWLTEHLLAAADAPCLATDVAACFIAAGVFLLVFCGGASRLTTSILLPLGSLTDSCCHVIALLAAVHHATMHRVERASTIVFP
jgi:hypothetical protein